MNTSAPASSAAAQNGRKKSSPRYRPATLGGISTPARPLAISSATCRAASGGSCSTTAPTALTRPGRAAAIAASAALCTSQTFRASAGSASVGTSEIHGDSSRWSTPVAAAAPSISSTSVNSPTTELMSRPRNASRYRPLSRLTAGRQFSGTARAVISSTMTWQWTSTINERYPSWRRDLGRPGAGPVRCLAGRHRAAQVQGADLGVLEHLLAGAGQAHLAVFEHDAVGGQPQPGPGVLLHQQDRLALGVHHAYRVENRLEHLGCQSHRRLVQDHQLRVEHEAAGELHEPLLPAGQAARLLVKPVVDLREHLLHAGETPLGQAALAQDVAAEADVLAHRHLAKQAVVLQYLDHAGAKDLTWRLAGQPLAVQRDLAKPWPEEPADGGEQGRFPGSVRPHHAGDPALHDLYGYPTQDITAAVAGDHARHLERARVLCWPGGLRLRSCHRLPLPFRGRRQVPGGRCGSRPAGRRPPRSRSRGRSPCHTGPSRTPCCAPR